MVKVIGEMDHYMSNAEVLTWMKNKRKQHAREDADDREQGITPTPRPQNLVDSLKKHERHLKSSHYPYEKNPSAYEGTNQDRSVHDFSEATMQKIQVPLVEDYRTAIKAKFKTVKEAQDELEVLQEKKELTEMEILMIHNHAPTSVETLQPMIEDIEKRFTEKEQEMLVECIKDVYRADEMKAAVEKAEKEPEKDGDKGSMELSKMSEAIR